MHRANANRDSILLRVLLLTGLVAAFVMSDGRMADGATPAAAIGTEWVKGGGTPEAYDMGGDPTVPHGAAPGGYIISKGSEPKHGAWMTKIQPDRYRGQRLRMSGYVRTENVEGRAGLVMRVDPAGSGLKMDDMRNRPIQGTTPWTRYEIVLDVPENSTGISCGILMEGAGQAWVDGVQFEIVDTTVPVTDRLFVMSTRRSGPGTVRRNGPGKTVRAGRGRVQWVNYDVTHGLADGIVMSLIQAQDGAIWACAGSGVSRYDGRNWATFTTEDGLAGNIGSFQPQRGLLQAQDGAIWVQTNGGVSRYDGENWTAFTTKDGLVANTIQALLQAQDGAIWAGTRSGVSRYDGENWTAFTTKDGLVANTIQALLQAQDGAIWVGTANGVSRYDGQNWTSFTTKDGLASNNVSPLLQAQDGAIWGGTWSDGVSRYDGENWTAFTTKDGLVANTVQALLSAQDGAVWVGTGSGISRYDEENWTSFTTKDGLVSNNVRVLLQTRDGTILVSNLVQPYGISIYDGENWTSFTTKDGLASNIVVSLLQARDGTLWAGTWSGVSRYIGGNWTTFTTQDGLAHDDVSSVLQTQDSAIWIGTDGGGVSRYDGQNLTSFTTKDGVAHDNVSSLLQSRDGAIWVGTWRGGISRYDGENWRSLTTKDGLASNIVYALLQTQDGALWVGTENGITRYDGENWTTFNTTRSTSLLQTPDGTIWVGTMDGLNRYDGKNWTSFTKKDGLASNYITSLIQAQDGAIWAGTGILGSVGISRYDGGNWTTFTTKDGLTSNNVSSLLEAQDGTLWIGSKGGINRYNGQVFQTLTREDGLVENAVNTIMQDREGAIWVGTTAGATRYCPPPSTPPSVVVDAVVADQRYTNPSTLSVPSTVVLLAFEFHGISLKTRPGGMVYRYRLEDYDTDWQTTKAQRVEYHDLPRGTYRFEVQAVDRDLAYSETPAVVTVQVHMPYERIGLFSALGIAFALLVWQSGRVVRRDRRLQVSNRALEVSNTRLRELDRLKSDFVSNVSHDLRTPLTSIKQMVDNMLEGVGGSLTEKQQHTLSRMEVNADRLTRLINDLLDLSRIEAGQLKLNPAEISLAQIGQDVVETVRPIAVERNITLSVQTGEPVAPVWADPDRVYQIMMNLVTNAIKFTPTGGRVEIRVMPEGDEMCVAVRDTGTGIPPEEVERIFEVFHQVERTSQSRDGAGLGLAIAKRLVDMQGGRLEVTSVPDQGSEFRFTLPVAQ